MTHFLSSDNQHVRLCSSLTVVVGAVDQVAVALVQVSQQVAEHGVVSGQRRQVERGAAIFVQQTRVGPRAE